MTNSDPITVSQVIGPLVGLLNWRVFSWLLVRRSLTERCFVCRKPIYGFRARLAAWFRRETLAVPVDRYRRTICVKCEGPSAWTFVGRRHR